MDTTRSILRLPILVAALLSGCGQQPAADPADAGRIYADLAEIDVAIGKYLAARGALPPDIGRSLVEAGCLSAILADPYESGETFDGVATYGYDRGVDSKAGEYYVVYSRGADGLATFAYDPEEHRIRQNGDDEIQTNLLVE